MSKNEEDQGSLSIDDQVSKILNDETPTAFLSYEHSQCPDQIRSLVAAVPVDEVNETIESPQNGTRDI